MYTPDVEGLRRMVQEQFQHALIQLAVPLQSPMGPVGEPYRAPSPKTVSADKKTANHSPDFASINWFGRVYTFTRPQAEVVASLWQAWKDDCPFLSQYTLLEISGSESTRLRDVFKNHAAWGTMIQHGPACGGTMGTYRLLPPRDNDF